ncbi:hypothetical protein FZS32_20700 [Salmonella enterica]|nr:hypothetical protein [Salmonella enterica]
MRLTTPSNEEKTTPLSARLLRSGENIVNIIYHVIKYHLITMNNVITLAIDNDNTIKPVTFIGLRHFSYNIVTTDNQDVHF